MSKINKVLYNVDQRDENNAPSTTREERWMARHNAGLDEVIGHATVTENDKEYQGIAPLGTNGLVPAEYLPSYVDTVVNGYYYQGKFYSDISHTTLITPNTSTTYVDLTAADKGTSYRWTEASGYFLIANQNAFGKVSDGTNTVVADSAMDTLTFTGIGGIDVSVSDSGHNDGIKVDGSTLETAISTEVNRATTAENGLNTAISAEVTRATTAENELNGAIRDEVDRATTAENGLNTAISAEVGRATTAENGLNTAISDEVDRAVTAENGLNTAISDEVDRATTAENSKADKVSNPTSGNFAGLDANGNLTNSGKKPADFAAYSHDHDDLYYRKTEVDTAIGAEKTRATEAEGLLQTGIGNEYQRAVERENWLVGAIQAENSRAVGEEASLRAAIDASITTITPGNGISVSGPDNKTYTVSLKPASNSDIGGIKLGYTTDSETQNPGTYPVEVDSNNRAYVAVGSAIRLLDPGDPALYAKTAECVANDIVPMLNGSSLWSYLSFSGRPFKTYYGIGTNTFGQLFVRGTNAGTSGTTSTTDFPVGPEKIKLTVGTASTDALYNRILECISTGREISFYTGSSISDETLIPRYMDVYTNRIRLFLNHPNFRKVYIYSLSRNPDTGSVETTVSEASISTDVEPLDPEGNTTNPVYIDNTGTPTACTAKFAYGVNANGSISGNQYRICVGSLGSAESTLYFV